MTKDVIEGVYAYISNMRPNMPLTAEEGARQQVTLFRHLSNLFNRVEGDFTQAFAATLKLFETHSNGVFAETHRYRFMDRMDPLSGKDREAFRAMVHMLVTLGPVAGRQQVLKQLSLEKAMEHGVNEAGKMRVRSFLGQ